MLSGQAGQCYWGEKGGGKGLSIKCSISFSFNFFQFLPWSTFWWFHQQVKLTKDKAEADNPMDRWCNDLQYNVHVLTQPSWITLSSGGNRYWILITTMITTVIGREEEDEDHAADDLKGFTKVHQSQRDCAHDHHRSLIVINMIIVTWLLLIWSSKPSPGAQCHRWRSYSRDASAQVIIIIIIIKIRKALMAHPRVCQ